MVEPAWAVADIAISGSKSEILRRRFVNMVRLHHCWKRVMCALLVMSSEQIVGQLQAHAEVKRPDTSLHTAIAAVPMLRLLTCTAQSCRQAGRTIRHKSVGFQIDPSALRA